MARKPGSGNDVTFLNLFFGISKCRMTKQMTFLNPEMKLDKIDMWSKEKFDFQNLTFLTRTWPDLRSNVKMGATIEFYIPNDP